MATKEENIVDAILTAISGISVANGYSFNIGSNYFDWRDTQLDASELPAINVKATEDRVNYEEDNKDRFIYVTIDLIPAGSTTACKDARRKKQDVLTAITAFLGTNIGTLIVGLEYAGSINQVDHETLKFAGVEMNFIIQYAAEYLAI